MVKAIYIKTKLIEYIKYAKNKKKLIYILYYSSSSKNDKNIGSSGVPATSSCGKFLKNRFVTFLPLLNDPPSSRVGDAVSITELGRSHGPFGSLDMLISRIHQYRSAVIASIHTPEWPGMDTPPHMDSRHVSRTHFQCSILTVSQIF